MALKYEELSSVQKAAVALVALGKDLSAQVLKKLSETEVERLTIEIANLRDIPADVEEQVLKECHQIFLAREYITEGGVDYARELLEQAIGRNRASEILTRLEGALRTTGFHKLKNIDSKQLVNFVRNEHPQTIALILTQLGPQNASSVLTELPAELQSDVALRIATMEKISPEVLKQIEQVLERQFDTGAQGEVSVSGGAKQIAEILNLMDTSTEKRILQTVEAEDPELATEIKNLMFVFEDVVLLDDRSIQRVLKEVETKDLSIALKAASDELKQKIFSNVSERVVAMIQEEMEFMGPMRLSDVEAAQQRIVESVRRLEEEGQIIVSGRGTKEDVIV
ncbi:MAG: flagellar motor switch protein FliG [Acidobacteria bacterium]|nr:flagellar motor switch protein FliG [Acidobacteriota bacterium]